MSQHFHRFCALRRAFCLLIISLVLGCGGPEFLFPLEGDPAEARQLITDNDYSVDYRSGSVRATEQFFRALNDSDGSTCWYLLDLRAAAAWHAFQHQNRASEANPDSIISLLQPLFPSGEPTALSQTSATKTVEGQKVLAEWTNGDKFELSLAMSDAGWRVVLPPPETKLANVDKNPKPTDTAEPVNFELDEESEPAQARPPSNPFGGGGFGY